MSRVLIVLALACLAACGAPVPRAAGDSLAGRIWDVRQQRFVSPDEAEALVAAADVALLGETHDNPAHHEIQARLLARFAGGEADAELAMEQMDREWQGAIDAARAALEPAPAIAKAGHMAASWRPERYEPLIALAAARGMRIVAANYSREKSRDVVARGIEAIGPQEMTRLALDRTWSPGRQARQRAILVAGHCGQDDPIIDKLVDVQRVRDAVMADAILEAPRTVAIIGRGHARRDLGVPLYIASRAPQRRVVSVGLVEVEDGKADPRDYDDASPGTHDLVWFTSRAARADPCESFKPIRR